MVVTGCSNDELPCLLVDCGTEESEAQRTELDVERVVWDCCSAESDTSCSDPGASWYDITTTGFAESLWLEITETDDLGHSMYQERHALPLILSDAGADWSSYFLELDQISADECETLADCPDLPTSGINTLFSCTSLVQGSVNWTLQPDAASTDLDASCVSWGVVLEPPNGCVEIEVEF